MNQYLKYSREWLPTDTGSIISLACFFIHKSFLSPYFCEQTASASVFLWQSAINPLVINEPLSYTACFTDFFSRNNHSSNAQSGIPPGYFPNISMPAKVGVPPRSLPLIHISVTGIIANLGFLSFKKCIFIKLSIV